MFNVQNSGGLGFLNQGFGGGGSGVDTAKLDALKKQIEQLTAYSAQPFNNDPFSVARSGNQGGTLQPYINRQTQQASDALYGGLLNYQPQAMQAGSAGGTPQASNVPQGYSMPSAMGEGVLNFGKRSWMKQ